MTDDDFDLEKFRVLPGQFPEQPQSEKSRVKRKQRCFTSVPCAWQHLLTQAKHIVTYRVALHLLHEGWRNVWMAAAKGDFPAASIIHCWQCGVHRS